ncbi:MAG TPA: universal stress protein [Gaiellaceae bacterium]|nr:universal stress protein [Gaiellaceae bacterium]
MSVVRTILVAYDDPESKTLARAADLAQALQASLIVTNVAPADRHEDADAAGYGKERLEQARAVLGERGLDAELVAATGQPAEAIIKLAEERGVDLIVVGMRKKGFLERLVEGSVAQDVMRRASCDVLAVH